TGSSRERDSTSSTRSRSPLTTPSARCPTSWSPRISATSPRRPTVCSTAMPLRTCRPFSAARPCACGARSRSVIHSEHPSLKIAKLESLHCDAGTRNFDFLKLTTDTGLVGWSEYNESFGGAGLSAVIDRLAPSVLGKDPRAWEAHVTLMYAQRRQASGGVVQ